MNEPRNRVVQVRRFGGPDGLEVVDAPLPTAGRGEVRVRALASGVEYTDVLIRRHLYPQTMHLRPPFVMGYDVVGDIDQLGDGVSGLQVGDRVADMTVVGSNATYRTLRSDRVARVPAGLDAAEAATLILSWTALSLDGVNAVFFARRPPEAVLPAETTTPAPTTRAVTTATRRAATRLTARLYTRMGRLSTKGTGCRGEGRQRRPAASPRRH